MTVHIPPIQSFEDFEASTLAVLRPGPPQSKYGALRFVDLDSDRGEEFEYLVDDWLSRFDRSIIAGPSGSGKSFLAIHLSMCVARGVPFFGANARRGLVIYQAGEGARGVKKRLRAYRAHHGVSPDEDIPFVLLTRPVDLYRADGDTASLIEEINRWKLVYDAPLELVVIDTLATATAGADENSGKDMSSVLANVANIAEKCGAHVMLVHHMNASATKLRGHTSIRANVDQVIEVDVEVEGDQKIRTATLSKQKDDEDGLKFRFLLKSIEVGHDASRGKAITSCVVVASAEEKQQKTPWSMGARITQREAKFFQALQEALKRYGERSPEGAHIPRNVREVVSYEAFKRVYAAQNPFDGSEDTPFEELKAQKAAHAAKHRQAVSTARASLSKPVVNVIGVEIPYIWWTGRPVQGFPSTFPKTEQAHSSAPIDGVDDIGADDGLAF